MYKPVRRKRIVPLSGTRFYLRISLCLMFLRNRKSLISEICTHLRIRYVPCFIHLADVALPTAMVFCYCFPAVVSYLVGSGNIAWPYIYMFVQDREFLVTVTVKKIGDRWWYNACKKCTRTAVAHGDSYKCSDQVCATIGTPNQRLGSISSLQLPPFYLCLPTALAVLTPTHI